jgi:hypothetical protein
MLFGFPTPRNWACGGLTPALRFRQKQKGENTVLDLKKLMTAVTILVLSLTGMPQAQATAHSHFTSSEKVIYFLDVSDSSDSLKLWTLLRSSLLEKVDVALGFPKLKGIAKPVKPTDLSISLINDNSQSAQIIEILSVRDAELIWDFIIKKVGGGSPTPARLKATYEDFFGAKGTYSVLVREYALGDEVKSVSASQCQKRAEDQFKAGNWMKNVSKELRAEAAKDTCSIILKLINGIKSADKLFENYNCDNKACSDVVGAVKRSAAVAADLARTSTAKSPQKLCIAIASDMLNAYPGMAANSVWNTGNAVKKSATTAAAESLGRQVAEEASIKFSQRVQLRVEVIGQGASSGFPRELTAKLDSYWRGFWTAAGIKTSGQKASLDQACK